MGSFGKLGTQRELGALGMKVGWGGGLGESVTEKCLWNGFLDKFVLLDCFRTSYTASLFGLKMGAH